MSMQDEQYYFPCVEDIKVTDGGGYNFCPVCETTRSFYGSPHNLKDCLYYLLERIKKLEASGIRE